ncbi:MAG: glycosyltransferase, partial [Sphingomonadaceae bacterium]
MNAALLLDDALQRTSVNPTASHCWLNLMAQTRALSDGEQLAQLIAAVQARLPAHGLAGFYRAMFLDLASGELQHLGTAAALLATLEPCDQDRLAAFFHFAWQRGLLYARDRPTFVRHLYSMGLPALATRMGYPATVTPPLRRPGPLRRVLLVAPELLSPHHPPTRMLLEQAEVLAQAGVEVSLLACQETMLPDFIHLLGQGSSIASRQAELGPWLERAAPGTQLLIADPRYSLMRRWHDMLDQIAAIEPDLVLFVGLHSGLINDLYQRYPVLGLATNSMAPLVPTDVWLTAQPALHGSEGDVWQLGQPPSLAYYHPFRARRRPCGAPAQRVDLGIPDAALLMISIGNQLATQIDGPWAARMGALMDAEPQLHWLLLGGSGAAPAALAAHAPGRVHALGHASNAQELIAMSDVYLNPPMMGGGLSVSEAMALGLPVLSLHECDGGDKLGSAAVADIE